MQMDAARILGRFSVLVATGLSLANCSSTGDLGVSASPRVVEYGQPVPKGGGVYKVGTPYKVGDQWFTPKDDPNYRNVGVASWYGLDFHGRRTANGEIYDMDALSAAHPTLPLPTYAKVHNLENGREVVVRVNDRGPFARDREIDVSKRAADLLGFTRKGTAKVEVTYLGRAPLSGDDGWATNVQLAQAPAAAPPAPVRIASAGDTFPVASIAPSPASYAPAPAAPGQIYIQAGSFRDANNANRLRYTLSSVGPVDVTPVDVAGITYFRVRVGPFADGEDISAALSQTWAAGATGARRVQIQ